MVVVEILTAIVSYLRDFTQRVYTILIDVINQIQQIISFFFTHFPADQPKKTLMLGLFWFVFTVGLLIFYAGDDWYKDGMSGYDKDVVLYSVNPVQSGYGDVSGEDGLGDEENGLPDEEDKKKPPPEGGLEEGEGCQTDEDCRFHGGEYMGERLCCYPDTFSDYACSGLCLKYPEYDDRDACKHPNACAYNEAGILFFEHISDSNHMLCLEKELPDKWCQDRASNTGKFAKYSGCCNVDKTSPCYGYCLKDVKGADCWDMNDCFEETSAFTISNEPGGIVE